MIPIKLNIQKFASKTIELSIYTGLDAGVTFQGKLECSSVADNANNQSTVTVSLYCRKQNANADTYGKDWAGNITIGDYQDSWTSLPDRIYVRNNWVLVRTFTATIPHNGDGTKSVYVSGYIKGATGTKLAKATSSGGDYFTLDTVPRYATITSFVVNKIDETSVGFSYRTDVSCDWTKYSTDGTNYRDLPVNGIVTVDSNGNNLRPNTTYNFWLAVRRTDSQQWTYTNYYVSQTTYPYPSVYDLPNFTIGEPVTLTINNPLNRQFKIYFNYNNNDYLERTITNSFSGWNDSEAINKFYELLSNAEQSSYGIKIVYGNYYDYAGEMSIFKINKEVSKPIFSDFNFEDVNSTTVALTNDSSRIVDGYSTIRVSIPSSMKAEGYKGASITKYNINGNDYNYADNFTQDIQNYALNYIRVSAKDTRSNEQLVEKPVNLLGYQKPKAILLKQYTDYERSNQGVGSQVTFKFKGTFWNNNFGNVTNTIKKATYKFKKTGASDYGSSININTSLITVSGNEFTFEGILAGDTQDNGFDIESSYNVVIKIEDELDYVEFNYVVIEGSPAFDLVGNCISLGGMYDEQVGGRVQIDGLIPLESGSNAYGKYIKFYDGTLIQFSTITYPASTPDGFTITFPIPFIDVNYYVNACAFYNYTPSIVTTFSTKATASIKLWNTYFDGNNWTRDYPHDNQMEFFAIGKWK